ncbi:recombinase family protein [Christensenella intestinihominis]|uniref:recombinase family protein n=1 Tax=Christensenella intestinihominis TaxID=1851429 RepID=UPI00082ED490|nr:recombinase family protein [Christensenella intestinihominis]
MNIYGYARVSTREQNEDRQMISLMQFPVERENIFLDKLSGKDFNRPQYRRMLRRLRREDLLVIHSIDRLGRNYEEIIAQWRIITKEKGAQVVVQDMPLLDTRQGRDLTGTLIADIVLQLLSYVAQQERENIRQRQAEGIAAAKLRGVRFGRPVKPIPAEFPDVYLLWKKKHISGREAARRLKVTHATFFKWAGEVANR